jgi:glycosyltransferase involved in cell wall biosynthesis
MIRVLHVTDSLGAGGIETTFLNVLRAWSDERPWGAHDVLAFAGGSLEREYRATADALSVASSHAALEREVLGAYDVIHFLFERCAHRLLPFAAAHSRAGIVYGKGYDLGGRLRSNDGLAWQPDESLMWGADRTTFTTPELAALFDAPHSRTRALGKAARLDRFLALPPPGDSTPPRVVCVANLHALKRLGDLVSAVARLVRDVPDVRVRFVGADARGERARLERLAAGEHASQACEFAGFQSDIAPHLAESRVFALPSGCEGVPTSMIEAMAAARPVVVTDVGHVRSAVTDGVEGFVVERGDIDALAAKLRLLLTRPQTAAVMGGAARTRARHHEVRAVASRLRVVLEQAAADRGGRSAA